MTKLEMWLQFVCGNLTAILIMIAIFGVLVLASLRDPRLPPDTGFGPEWECTAMAKGDPVCIKKQPADPNPAKSK
jgi:hypothetical protein